MKISNADIALTDSEDSKRSISVTTVLLKIHIFVTTTTTNAKKKIYKNDSKGQLQEERFTVKDFSENLRKKNPNTPSYDN